MAAPEPDAGLVARLRQRGEQALAHARELLRSSDWRVEADDSGSGDRVQSAQVPGIGRIFLLTAMYSCTAEELWKVLGEDIDKLPTWSGLFSKAYVLQSLDSQTDVMYHETAGKGGGLISPRDWVSLRHWEKHSDWFQTAAVDCDYPLRPKQKQKHNVRGETVVSMYSVHSEAGAARTRFQFLSCVRMGGWLPQAVIDRFMVPSYMDFAAQVRERISK